MKEYNTRKLSIFVSILNFILIASSLAFFVVNFDKANFIFQIIEIVISIPLSFFFGVLFHEFGHYVFGIISGYQFLSFQVLWFKFHYENRKLKISLVKNALIGQCLMAPKANEDLDNVKFKLYLYGGSIANLILFILPFSAFLLLFILNNSIKYDCLILSIINLMLFLSNGLPLNVNGIYNDTLNIKLMSEHDSIRHAVLNTLKLQKLSDQGYLIEEIDDDILLNDCLELSNYCTLKYPFILYKTMKLFHEEDKDPFKEMIEINRYINVYPVIYKEMNISFIMLHNLLFGLDSRWIIASKEYKKTFDINKNDDLIVKLDMAIYDYKYNNVSLDETIDKINKYSLKIESKELLDIEKEFLKNVYQYAINHIDIKEEEINSESITE